MIIQACSHCGLTHKCPSDEPTEPVLKHCTSSEHKTKGYSLYFVKCHCGCGCGHSCSMVYGPYAKVHNAIGASKLAGDLGKQLTSMRAASAATRKKHLSLLHKI